MRSRRPARGDRLTTSSRIKPARGSARCRCASSELKLYMMNVCGEQVGEAGMKPRSLPRATKPTSVGYGPRAGMRIKKQTRSQMSLQAGKNNRRHKRHLHQEPYNLSTICQMPFVPTWASVDGVDRTIDISSSARSAAARRGARRFLPHVFAGCRPRRTGSAACERRCPTGARPLGVTVTPSRVDSSCSSQFSPRELQRRHERLDFDFCFCEPGRVRPSF